MRAAGLIWSPLLKTSRRVSDQLIHVSDWLPTLSNVAGYDFPSNLDGINMWKTLSENLPSPRHEVVHNIDPIIPYTSYLYGNWKYVNGTVNPVYDIWLGEIPLNENPNAVNYTLGLISSSTWKVVSTYQLSPLMDSQEVLNLRGQSKIVCRRSSPRHPYTPCEPLLAPCLFNIKFDPCERENRAEQLPRYLHMVEEKLNMAKQKAVRPLNVPSDPKSNPALNNYQWTFWTDLVEAGHGN